MAKSDKLDLYKLHKDDYATPKKPILLTVKPARYMTIVGQGTPGSEVFHTKFGALYGMAFTVKMNSKLAARDYAVCKLEGLYWVKGKQRNFTEIAMDEWCWKMLIRTPDFIKPGALRTAAEQLIEKGKDRAVQDVKLETINEGRCVQCLHVGPYDQESATVERMRVIAESEGLTFHGLHHEIYLSDPRRVAPERLRTILRQPVK